jgi:hypothetical protein
MACLYSSQSFRFYDLSPLLRFWFIQNPLSVLEQLIYYLGFKLTIPFLWSCVRPSILPNHLKFAVTDMLINKLFYFKSRIVIVEWSRSYADLPHMPQLVHMRHIAMANQLKRPATNCLGSSYDLPGYPSITVGALACGSKTTSWSRIRTLSICYNSPLILGIIPLVRTSFPCLHELRSAWEPPSWEVPLVSWTFLCGSHRAA